MPLVSINWQTPYEVLFKKSPSYDNLRVMGCLCYAVVIRKGHDKFDARGRKSVLLGYPSQQKGYMLYDLVTKEIFYSRDVEFHEHVFPFKAEASDTSTSVENRKGIFPLESHHTNDDEDTRVRCSQSVILQWFKLMVKMILPRLKSRFQG